MKRKGAYVWRLGRAAESNLEGVLKIERKGSIVTSAIKRTGVIDLSFSVQ